MSTPSASAEDLTWVDVGPILEKLREQLTSKDVVLVGGQALNFWHSYHADRGHPDLRDDPPLTSKDLDFCGDRGAVKTCALKLGGIAHYPPPFDPSPSTGLVLFVDSAGDSRQIDFIDQPLGLKANDVREMAIPAEIHGEDGHPTGTTLWVMHPVHCMFSRVHNTVTLPEYQTPHGRLQLKLSVTCARAFLIQLLELVDADIRTITNLAERIFHFCHDIPVGRRVKHEYGVEPFDAVPADHARLPEKFRSLRYPQMLDWITRRRERALGRHGQRDLLEK